MARTTSLNWPNMFDVSRNRVSVAEDNASIVSRSRLLILTDPTELYNNPNQGVGLKKYLWQYKTSNLKAIIQDKIKEQFRLHEPCSDSEKTQFVDGLVFTGSTSDNIYLENQKIEMTVGIVTTFGDTINVELNDADLQERVDTANEAVSSMLTR